MNRKQKIIISVTGIFIVLLILVGLTYAYFLTNIRGNTNTKSIEVTTANLILEYGENTNVVQGIFNAEPGYSVTKYFTATNNGNASVDYVATLDSIVNELTRQGDLEYTLTCASYLKVGFSLAANGTPTGTINGTCNGVDATQFPSTTTTSIMIGNRVETTQVHYYVLTVNYKEMGVDQSDDMNKTFSALVNIKDIKSIPNPYQSNTELLSYNIINNALTGANGEVGSKFVAAPLTKPAAEKSGSWGTDKYTTRKRNDFPGWNGVTYGTTQEEADNGVNEVSGTTDLQKCNSVKGNYISDVYNNYYDGEPYGYLEDCDSNGIPTIRGEVIEYERVLSVTPDDYGTSYYFRGSVVDNYLNFAGKCWRIVRIEGDGSVEIILADKDAECSLATKGKTTSAFIGTGNYGYTYDYVTNSLGEITNVQFKLADYLNGTTNSGDSMKAKLNTFLGTLSQANQDKLKYKQWCLGDTTILYNQAGALLTDSKIDIMNDINEGYYNYKSHNRLNRVYRTGPGATQNAILKCDGETFTNQIGTLTADEIAFAGSYNDRVYNFPTSITTDYLRRNSLGEWWTLTQSGGGYGADWSYFVIGSLGCFDFEAMSNEDVSYSLNIRPVVSLVSGTEIMSGNGTLENPYIVKMD